MPANRALVAALSRDGGRRGRRAVLADEDAAHAAPDLDARRRRPVERRLDDAAGGAARLDEAAVADVDADVAHRALLTAAESEQVAGKQPARVLDDRQAHLRLLLGGARNIEVERGLHELHEAAAVEPFLRRAAAELVLRADLRAGHLNY